MPKGGVTRHGHTMGGEKSPEYRVWRNICSRCENPNVPSFKNYGGRGIRICAGWRASFIAFHRDMGDRPSPRHSVDRIDNSRGYECWYCDDCTSRGAGPNCRWATAKQQCRNTRANTLLTWNGQTKTVVEWSEVTGLSKSLIIARTTRLGWPVDRALGTPAKNPALITHCPHGHEYTPENTGRYVRCWRVCLTCARERTRLAKRRKKQ